MFADIGFDGWGINRINYMDLENRKANKDLEFIQLSSESLGEESYIFIHLLDSGYCTPAEISFQGSLWINTDPELPTYGLNYIEIAQNFLQLTRARLQWYRHNIKLMVFGCDC